MSVFFTRRGKAAQRVNFVDYIQSSGTQYIDTLFKPNNNTRIVMDAQYAATNSTTVFYFGVRDASDVNEFALRLRNNSEAFMSEYGSQALTYTATYTNRLIIDWNKNAVEVGSASGTHSATTFQCNYNQCLFALNSGGEVMDYTQALRLYSCQIYDNGTLVRDFWPCYDPDGVACLYDKVEEKYYYNAGTGEFVAKKTETGDFYWEKYAVGYDAVYTKTSWGQAYDLSVTRYLKKDLSVTMINGSPYWVGASMAVENYPQYPYMLSSTTSNRDTVMYGPMEHTVAAYKDAAKAPYKFTLTGATEVKGEYVATVHATKSDAYPDNGVQDGYWYVKVTQ